MGRKMKRFAAGILGGTAAIAISGFVALNMLEESRRRESEKYIQYLQEQQNKKSTAAEIYLQLVKPGEKYKTDRVIEILRDKSLSNTVEKEAFDTLGRIGDVKAYGVILSEIDTNNFYMQNACMAIAKIDGDRAAGDLIKRLGYPGMPERDRSGGLDKSQLAYCLSEFAYAGPNLSKSAKYKLERFLLDELMDTEKNRQNCRDVRYKLDDYAAAYQALNPHTAAHLAEDFPDVCDSSIRRILKEGLVWEKVGEGAWVRNIGGSKKK